MYVAVADWLCCLYQDLLTGPDPTQAKPGQAKKGNSAFSLPRRPCLKAGHAERSHPKSQLNRGQRS